MISGVLDALARLEVEGGDVRHLSYEDIRERYLV